MAFRIRETDIDGRTSVFVEEAFEDEIAEAFLKADKDAGEEVDVIYVIDHYTGEDIECWRQDWMTVKVEL